MSKNVQFLPVIGFIYVRFLVGYCSLLMTRESKFVPFHPSNENRGAKTLAFAQKWLCMCV